MGTLLYDLYTLCIVLPLFILASILTALITTIGCRLGNGHFWGYYPGKWWSWFTIRLLFLPVKVEGREHRVMSLLVTIKEHSTSSLFMVS